MTTTRAEAELLMLARELERSEPDAAANLRALDGRGHA
jgi:hypothetical protein